MEHKMIGDGCCQFSLLNHCATVCSQGLSQFSTSSVLIKVEIMFYNYFCARRNGFRLELRI